jgi:hypothetical protein
MGRSIGQKENNKSKAASSDAFPIIGFGFFSLCRPTSYIRRS